MERTNLTREARRSPLDTALFEAVRDKDHAEVARLLSDGADPSARRDGATPLMCAAQYGATRCVELLLPFSDPMAADFNGWTPLMFAARYERTDTLNLLLPLSDPAKADRKGLTALSLSAFYGKKSSVEALLPFSDPEFVDGAGHNALHRAAKSGCPDCVRLVANAAPGACLARTPDGSTALMIAAENDFEACVTALLSLSEVDSVDLRGRTALMRASAAGRWHAVLALLPAANPDLADYRGDTAVTLGLCSISPVGVLEALIPHSNLDTKAPDDRPLLDLVAEAGFASLDLLIRPHMEARDLREASPITGPRPRSRL